MESAPSLILDATVRVSQPPSRPALVSTCRPAAGRAVSPTATAAATGPAAPSSAMESRSDQVDTALWMESLMMPDQTAEAASCVRPEQADQHALIAEVEAEMCRRRGDEAGAAAAERVAFAIRGRASMDRDDEPSDHLVWLVCRYMPGRDDLTCDRCPAWEERPKRGRCKRGCRAMAEEVVNIVQTGNPWRKPPEEVVGTRFDPIVRSIHERRPDGPGPNQPGARP